MSNFNPNMLILARESRGLNQYDLADLLNIDQSYISKIELNLRPVNDELVDKLSKVLKFPRNFFFENENIYPSISYHRKRQSLNKKELEKIYANINIIRIHIKKLLLSTEIVNDNIPFLDSDLESPQKLAKSLYQRWKLPKGPIQNLTNVIENEGGIIIDFDFGTKLIDGLSLVVKNFPPLIFINKDFPGDRLRFTLAHELGHIVMHSFYSETMEAEANLFAAELLMPEDEIAPYLEELTLNKLIDLKRHWKVSIAALIERAYQLDKISKRKKQHFYTLLNKQGYRYQEPVDIPHEQGTILKELFDWHLTDLNYSMGELSNILLCYKDDLYSLYKFKKDTFQMELIVNNNKLPSGSKP